MQGYKFKISIRLAITLLYMIASSCFESPIPGGPIFRPLLYSTIFFFTLLDRASFFHYNNTKIIKFG